MESELYGAEDTRLMQLMGGDVTIQWEDDGGGGSNYLG
jgi:hypothetical protein